MARANPLNNSAKLLLARSASGRGDHETLTVGGDRQRSFRVDSQEIKDASIYDEGEAVAVSRQSFDHPDPP
jgi:hypothetical protein